MTCTRRFILGAAAIVAPSTVYAQRKLDIPAKWYAVLVEDNAFTVEMPGIPDHRVINDVSARGTPFTLHSYSLESGGFSYAAQTALYPADVDVTQPRRVLQAALDGRASQLAGRRWDRTEWRDVPAGASVESIGAVQAGAMLRLLSLLKGRRFVSLAFLGPGVDGPDANRFFRSLKLTP
ncbi:MAG: hypothetical protein KIS73_04095 [Enhydrobacter sp.]|nr:hypothetical protein [Enhydrobacter sp.]